MPKNGEFVNVDHQYVQVIGAKNVVSNSNNCGDIDMALIIVIIISSIIMTILMIIISILFVCIKTNSWYRSITSHEDNTHNQTALTIQIH